MNRSVQEVTFQAARLKEPGYRPTTESVADLIVQDATKKAKKVAAPVVVDEKSSETGWTQDEQKLLETAIVKYPKTTAGDRWQKVANTVPGRTKEECLARYKYLVQKVKEQKSKEVSAQSQQQSDEQAKKSDAIERVENVEGQEETANVADEYEVEPEPEPEPVVKKSGGKPRNKRKERKKRMEFSSDEDDHYNYE